MPFVRVTVGALIRVAEFALADFVNGSLARVTLSFSKIFAGGVARRYGLTLERARTGRAARTARRAVPGALTQRHPTLGRPLSDRAGP
jgi:hypothetical protein